jgi:hypothetical protein
MYLFAFLISCKKKEGHCGPPYEEVVRDVNFRMDV